MSNGQSGCTCRRGRVPGRDRAGQPLALAYRSTSKDPTTDRTDSPVDGDADMQSQFGSTHQTKEGR
jgi:hypothetical protein